MRSWACVGTRSGLAHVSQSWRNRYMIGCTGTVSVNPGAL
jgi:hypothetical protein